MVAARVELAATINFVSCYALGLTRRVCDHQVGDHDNGSDAQSNCAERSYFGAEREELKDTADDGSDDEGDERDADPVFRFHVM